MSVDQKSVTGVSEVVAVVEEKVVQLSVRMDESLRRRAKAKAMARGVTLTEVVGAWIAAWLAEDDADEVTTLQAIAFHRRTGRWPSGWLGERPRETYPGGGR